MPLKNSEYPEEGLFSTVREVIVAVSRMKEENKIREEILSSDDGLAIKSKEVGITIQEIQKLLLTNYENATPQIERLSHFLESDTAKNLYAEQRKSASNIRLGPEIS